MGLRAEPTFSKSIAIKPHVLPHSQVLKKKKIDALSAVWVSGPFQPHNNKARRRESAG